MKNIILLTLLFFGTISCKKTKEPAPIIPPVVPTAPTASFTYNKDVAGLIAFTNDSKNADTYEWDFGDNSSKSIDSNPTHKYASNGKYKVTLKAVGKGGTNSKDQDVPVAGYQDDIAAIDDKVAAFMTKYNLPGVTLAISKGGKLVYVKGYGFGDKEKGEKVTIDNRFRVGSMSKTICAIAITKLIQDNKLKLDDKVFGDGAILGEIFGKKAYSADLQLITVRNLLNHTAGGWGTEDNQGDIMGQVITANNTDFFSHILDNYPLVTKPGTRYSYANFGYFILARIAEKVSGKAYLNYLNEDVFKSIGLTNKIELSGAIESERKPKEVKYYGQSANETNLIYKLNFERRDGSGGLLFSATDYLKILNAIDGNATRPDVLNAASITNISTTPVGISSAYACGMQIYPGNYWTHSGSINCMHAQWWKAPNDITAVVITNSRADPGNTALSNQFGVDFSNFAAYFYQIGNTTKWQDIDQF